MATSSEIGRVAEEFVLNVYIEKGFKLIAKNFEYRIGGVQGRLGEIDLILERDDILHLVEVKYRASNNFGTTALQIDSKKINYLYKAWQFFLQKPENKHLINKFVQFDVAVFESGVLKIIPNCYQFDSYYGKR